MFRIKRSNLLQSKEFWNEMTLPPLNNVSHLFRGGRVIQYVFCCRKRYSLESLAAQWIQGFAQLVFLFFCAFFKPFPNPHMTY